MRIASSGVAGQAARRADEYLGKGGPQRKRRGTDGPQRKRRGSGGGRSGLLSFVEIGAGLRNGCRWRRGRRIGAGPVGGAVLAAR